MRSLMKPGDIIVVYGRPQSASGGVVDLGQARVWRINHPLGATNPPKASHAGLQAAADR